MFKNHRKSLIQHFERSELRLSGQKLIKDAKKGPVLPDRSVFTGQKLMENAKIEKCKRDILSYFQTL